MRAEPHSLREQGQGSHSVVVVQLARRPHKSSSRLVGVPQIDSEPERGHQTNYCSELVPQKWKKAPEPQIGYLLERVLAIQTLINEEI